MPERTIKRAGSSVHTQPGGEIADPRRQPIMQAMQGLLRELDRLQAEKGYPTTFTFKMDRGEWILSRRL